MKRSPIKRKTGLKGRSNLKRTPLKPVSDKRKKENSRYSIRKKAYFQRLAEKQGRKGEVPFCEAYGPPHLATDWHHKLPLGRGGKLNQDDSLMMAVSRRAHDWIGNNPKEAESRGWLLKR